MLRIILSIAIAMMSVTAVSTTAHAKCITPTLEFSADRASGSGIGSDGGMSSDHELEFGITFKIPLGSAVKQLCRAEIAEAKADLETEIANAATKRAKAEIDEAKADQAETKALKEKVALCSTFSKNTAPNSIKNFCGDLL